MRPQIKNLKALFFFQLSKIEESKVPLFTFFHLIGGSSTRSNHGEWQHKTKTKCTLLHHLSKWKKAKCLYVLNYWPQDWYLAIMSFSMAAPTRLWSDRIFVPGPKMKKSLLAFFNLERWKQQIACTELPGASCTQNQTNQVPGLYR